MKPLILLSLTLILGHGPLSANSGQIKGTVPLPEEKPIVAPAKKYLGKISGQVSAAPKLVAGVWLESKELKAPQNPAPFTLSQKNYQFAKSLLIVPVGTLVAFPNSDSDYHNIYSLSRTKRFDLGRYKKSENPAPTIRFDQAGFVALHCEIHDHMRANIIIVDSPYYTLTDATGAFTLKGVPPGNYILHAQYHRKSSLKIPVSVKPNQTLEVNFPSK